MSLVCTHFLGCIVVISEISINKFARNEMKCLQAHNLHWHKMLLLAHGGSHGTVSKRVILFIFVAGPESMGRWDESVKWGSVLSPLCLNKRVNV